MEGESDFRSGRDCFHGMGPEASLIMTDGWFNALTGHKMVGGTRDTKQGAEADTCILMSGQQGALSSTRCTHVITTPPNTGSPIFKLGTHNVADRGSRVHNDSAHL